MKLTYYNNPMMGGVSHILITCQDRNDDVKLTRYPSYMICHFFSNDGAAWDTKTLQNKNQEFLVYDTPVLGVEIFWLNGEYEHTGYVDGNRHLMKIHKYHKIPMVNVRSIDVTPIYLASVRE